MAAQIKINDREEDKKDAKDVKKESKVNKKETGNHKKKDAEHADELQEKLDSKEQEAKETYDRFLRLSAEFENYKKRSEREMRDFKKFANESLLKEMLPVVDNLQLALESSKEKETTTGGLHEGVELTLKEMLRVLEKFGVKPVAAMDKPFDPSLHQAMMQEESDSHDEQTVIRELQKGYTIHDRLLRPAMVVVSKKIDITTDDY
jgi:molecular chaperone GrpE